LPALADRFALKRILLTGLAADTLAMGLLAGSEACWGITQPTGGRLVIAVVSTRVRSTMIYVVLPWAIAASLLVFRQPAARGLALPCSPSVAWPALGSSR
jgi:hypothetical protein